MYVQLFVGDHIVEVYFSGVGLPVLPHLVKKRTIGIVRSTILGCEGISRLVLLIVQIESCVISCRISSEE